MIEFRLLGTVTLTDADGRQVQSLLAQPRRFALLAYLAAATPRGMQRRDHLLPLFWPELDQARARAALRQALHVLRGELGPTALTSRGDEEIGLDFDCVRCDVADFERAIASQQLDEALDVYRGHLLEGFFIPAAPEFERWLEMERARLQEAASDAARALVTQCEGAGDLTAAAQWARRAARLTPFDESLVRQLIGVLDRLGDRAGALLVYDEFAQRLTEEYEAQPAAETQALIAAVRSRETAGGTVALPRVELVARLRAALAGRYRIERKIAHGGTATVCLAQDLKHDRPVAIKVLHPELAAVVGAERFLHEIQIAARLQHPHIVPLHDSGEADGLLYFVMPYVPGDTLRDRLDREPQLPVADAIGIACEVAAALGYAHGLGLVHRDIKPENILLEDGRAMVADFGIARAISTAGSDRLTETGIALGSPAYMSPEQATEDGHIDGRSDLYALACVLYEMLTGAPPFTGPTAQAVLARHAVDPVAPIRTVREAVPWGVERTVFKALAKVPADRHSTAVEFATALAAPTEESKPRERWPRSKATKIAVGAVLSIAGALAMVVGFNVGGWRDRLWAMLGSGRIRSLAVLPLENLSGDSTQETFVEGMTSALTTDLAGVGALRVVSRRSSNRFKGTSMDARTIGESLGVEVLVEGGIQRSEDRLRVDLQVIDAKTGEQLWAHHFGDQLQNRFALEDEMSREIISALHLHVTAAEATQLRTPPTSNLEAYELYLRGKNRVLRENREDDSVAILLLEQAVALDPSFAAAYAELAHAYGLRATQFVPVDLEARDRAAVAAERALDLNPDLAEGHYARAFLLWGPGRRFAHELSIAEDRRALALNPNLARAHHHLGMVFLHIGLLDESVAQFQKTLALDPGEGFAQQRIGIAMMYQGRYAEGLRTFRQVGPDFNPSLWHYQVVSALLYLGQDSAALSLVEQYLHDRPQDPGGVVTATRAILFAKRGDARRAETDIQTAIKKGAGFQHFHHAAYSIAMAYALLHRPEPAVRFLRQAATEGMPCYPCLANDPYLASLRGDPGFVAFMRDLKSQWKQYRAAFAAPAP